MSISSNDIINSTEMAMEYIQHIKTAIDKLKNGDKTTCLLITRYIGKSIICDQKHAGINDNVCIDNSAIH